MVETSLNAYIIASLKFSCSYRRNLSCDNFPAFKTQFFKGLKFGEYTGKNPYCTSWAKNIVEVFFLHYFCE